MDSVGEGGGKGEREVGREVGGERRRCEGVGGERGRWEERWEGRERRKIREKRSYVQYDVLCHAMLLLILLESTSS